MQRRLTFGSLLFIALILGMHSSVIGQETDGAKVARLLNESGVNLTKIDAEMWTIPFEGKRMKDITVMIGVAEGTLVSFALIPQSKNVKFPTPILMKLLNLNDEYDTVKVGIDDKGIVFVRIDLTVRTLDKQQLIDSIDQIAAAVDQVFTEIRPHLPKAK
jgi:hypothetical protein